MFRARVLLAAALYARLGVERSATDGEVKAAYRKKALQCHPDVVPADRKTAAEAEFRRVSEAYATLSDPAERRRYDLSLAPAPGGAPVRPSTSSDDVHTMHPAAARPPRPARPTRKPFVMRDAERSFRGAFEGKSVHDVLFSLRFSKKFPKAAGDTKDSAKAHSTKSERPSAASSEERRKQREAYDAAVNEALRSAAEAHTKANPFVDPRSVKVSVRPWNRPPPPSGTMPFRPFRNMAVPEGVAVPPAPVAPEAHAITAAEGIDEVVKPQLARPIRPGKLSDPEEVEYELARLRRLTHRGPDNEGVMYSYQRVY